MKAKRSNGGNYTQPETGTHMARLVQIVDLGLQPAWQWQGKEIPAAYKVRLTYELVNSKLEDGRPHWVSEEITNSDNEKSTLSARVRALGGSFNDLGDMVGKPCMVTLVENAKGYTKIDGQGGVGGVPNGIEVPQVADSSKLSVLDLENPDLDIFDSLPDFVQEKITGNEDYEGSTIEQALLAREAGAQY